jgi:MinD superfamily P-loop ATPase
MATPIIRELKTRIGETETGKNGEKKLIINHLTIIDVPPGTSCPVIEAVRGSDFTVLVTEPTPFGLNDLTLAVETLRKLGIPFGVIINRHGIGDKEIENYCKKENIPILMRIPVDKEIAIAYSKGIPFINLNKGARQKFNSLLPQIQDLLGKNV